MPDLETDFAMASEPLVLELEALRRELAAANSDRLAAAAALERRLVELEAMRGELAQVHRHRLDAPAWAPGVYRQGAVVQHFFGQYFEAAADTALEPGDGVAWRRLGLHGFRYCGLFVDGAAYTAGDLVARDGSMMFHTGEALTWLALRGKPGRPGDPGKPGLAGDPGRPGEPGKAGRDGASLERLEAAGGLLWAVMDDGVRRPIALEAVQLEGAGA